MVEQWLQLAVFIGIVTAFVPLLGGYMARVYQNQTVLLERAFGPFERVLYRLLPVDTAKGQDWKSYARSVIVFSVLAWLALYLILRTQGIQPFNPEGFGSEPWNVSFNTASSFVTNTNWQFYGGETTLSYFSQMAGLTTENFVSAPVGMAVVVAMIRGIVARGGSSLGNFYQGLVRGCLYILLPLAIIVAVLLVSQGVLQNLSSYLTLGTLNGGHQTPAGRPVSADAEARPVPPPRDGDRFRPLRR